MEIKATPYTYSYSGADCRAFAYFNEGKAIDLSSLATISVSVHEAKSPVRRLGERGVSGYTRGIRTVAGSMVFVIVKDHPLKQLALLDPVNKISVPLDEYANINIDTSYSRDLKSKGYTASKSFLSQGYTNKLSTLITPFNIEVVYKSEVEQAHESAASFMLEEVEIINEGLVTSVNDMISEVVVQFVAKDLHPLSKEKTTAAQLFDSYMDLEGNKIVDKANDEAVGVQDDEAGLFDGYSLPSYDFSDEIIEMAHDAANRAAENFDYKSPIASYYQSIEDYKKFMQDLDNKILPYRETQFGPDGWRPYSQRWLKENVMNSDLYGMAMGMPPIFNYYQHYHKHGHHKQSNYQDPRSINLNDFISKANENDSIINRILDGNNKLLTATEANNLTNIARLSHKPRPDSSGKNIINANSFKKPESISEILIRQHGFIK